MLKYCAVFSLCAGVGLAGDYITGQAARAIIGQTTFTSQDSGASNLVVGGVGAVAYANNTLFVADSNRLGNAPLNNRVLMYNNLSRLVPSPTAEIAPNIARCPVCVQGASLVLGQPDFTSSNYNTAVNGMRLPTAVATDGRYLAVADTANNRILIWKEIPTEMDQPADIVVGQPDFVTVQPVVVSASSLRAPQGVWIQNGQLFVADTQNNRVMVWNSIPTKNNQPADLVLGQPNFTTVPNLDLTKSSLVAANNTLLNPVSVSSDGKRLFVSDLGFNRVMIWNSIPTKTQQPADVEIGQINFATAFANDNTDLCASVGVDANNDPIYPATCDATLSFPRFALSDGTRLYVADGGNDRILIFNQIPTINGAHADVILGQPDQYNDIEVTSQTDLFDPNLQQSASDVTPAPTGLAWDGTNLYVADSTNFRVLVFTPEMPTVAAAGVVNAASLAIYAQGSITFAGTINAGDQILIDINNPVQVNPAYYQYQVVTGDTLQSIVSNVTNLINASNSGAGDPNVLAVAQLQFNSVQLLARSPGALADTIQITATTGLTITTTSTVTNGVTTTTETTNGTADVSATTSGTSLANGGNAATLAPGAIVSIQGSNLSDNTLTTSADIPSYTPNGGTLPLELGGVEVYIDGIRSPILMVSPNQVDVQVPFELIDTNSSSLYVRTLHNNGTVTVTNAVGLPISTAAPGIYGIPGQEPRQALALHYSSYATGVIDVAGSPSPGDVVTVSVGVGNTNTPGNSVYSYTVLASDTLTTIRDSMVALINGNSDSQVVAVSSGQFERIILRAKVPGAAGDGLPIAASVTGQTVTSTTDVVTTSAPTEVMTAINSSLCCANVGGAPVTVANPAVPGEMIVVFATGLGLVEPQPALSSIQDGVAYDGPILNYPNQSVSAIIGGVTGNVLSASLQVGAIGVYTVVLQLSNSLTTNPTTQVYISSNIYTSNIVIIPVVAQSSSSVVN